MNAFPADNQVSLYRLFDYTGGMITLKNRKLRFKTACQFNDPYELQPRTFIPIIDINNMNDKEFLDQVSRIKVEPLHTMLSLLLKNGAHEKILKELKPLMINNSKKYIEQSREIFDFYRKTSFISCLTQGLNDVKFWANYADKGRGLGIEFNISVERDNIFRLAKPVKYIDNIPCFYNSLSDLFHQSYLASIPSNWKHLFDHFSYTKNNQWSDEDEWRLIIPGVPGEVYLDQDFNEEDIKAVYLGYAISDKNEIKKLIKSYSHKIELYETVLKEGEYGLQFNKLCT